MRNSSRPTALGFALVTLVMATGCVTTTDADVSRPRDDVILRGEIERRVAEIPYMHGAELLSNLERLADIGDPAAPQLVAALDSPQWLTRTSAAWTLGVMGDRRNIPALRELLDDRVPGVR